MCLPSENSVNPFKPSGISYRDQLEQSISVFKVCLVVFFIFI